MLEAGMTAWWDGLKSLTALALVATLADLLMPTGSMRKYARLVTGLLLMLALLQPLKMLLFGPSTPTVSLQEILNQMEGLP
jgi:stage III sporulation protein AF